MVSTEGFGKQGNTREWTSVTSKYRIVKPNKRDIYGTATSAPLIMTTNWFTLLSNLEANNVVSSGVEEQSERISKQIMHKTMKQNRIGIKIPTVVNGRIMYNDDRRPSAAKKRTTQVFGTNFNNKEHKVKIVGDSHPR
jgi:hypothetical protein